MRWVCLAFWLASTAHAQSVIVTGGGSFGVSGFAATEQTDRPQITLVEPVRRREVVPESKPLLVISTVPNCRMCRVLQRDIAAGLFDGFVISYRSDPSWDKGFPVIRWQENGVWKYPVNPRTGRHIGYDKSVLTMLQSRLLGKSTQQPQPVMFRPVRRSHQELVQLHNRLHGGGQWTWPGDLETHLRVAHGVRLD